MQLCEAENCRLRALYEARHANTAMVNLQERVKSLENENKLLQDKVQNIQQNAAAVREVFVSDIGELLSESRTITSLRAKLKAMELKLHTVSALETELSQTYAKLNDLEDQLKAKNQPRELLKRKPKRPLLLQLDDKMLLMVFSFLQTGDVLYAAQVTVNLILLNLDVILQRPVAQSSNELMVYLASDLRLSKKNGVRRMLAVSHLKVWLED